MGGFLTRSILVTVLPAFAACSSSPIPIPEDPTTALDLAESMLDRGRIDDALAFLDDVDRDSYIEDDRARFDTLRMRALVESEEYYDAFEVSRDFIDEHRFSPRSAAIEELHFRAGKALLLADDDDGELVLQHFVERFEASPFAPEALKLLGDFAFGIDNFPLAEVRFTQLLESHPSSEWAAFARYRLAMSAFRRVRGPQYDLDQMIFARNELAHYLSLEPERPEFRRDAREGLAILERWIAERHVIIADFYRRVGNTTGERIHLGIAMRDFPTTDAGQRARDRLGPTTQHAEAPK